MAFLHKQQPGGSVVCSANHGTAKNLGADDAAGFGSTLVRKGWADVLACVLKLPCALDLTLKQVKPWLEDAFVLRDLELFSALSKLPVMSTAEAGCNVQLLLGAMHGAPRACTKHNHGRKASPFH
jgi:hypothetical protein